MSVDVNWDELLVAARGIKQRAYAPYSKFPVGAAAVVTSGRIVVGCNVENASYGLTLCAECSLVSALHASGGGQLVAVVCVGPDDQILMPCGRCRQLLYEHAEPGMKLQTLTGPMEITELLPQAFGPQALLQPR